MSSKSLRSVFHFNLEASLFASSTDSHGSVMSTTEEIDPLGDLVLVVGSDPIRRFRVSRVALRLATPVWKAMLTGQCCLAMKLVSTGVPEQDLGTLRDPVDDLDNLLTIVVPRSIC